MILETTTIIALIERYGYGIIFPVSIVEGPVIAVISGFLVSLGLLNAFVVFAVLLLGDIVGDTLYYLLGKWGGVALIKRWGRYLGFTEDRVRGLTGYFETRGWKLLLISKTQAIGSVILFSAGAAKMPFGKFIKYNLVGSIPKIMILEAIGLYSGASFALINKYLNSFAAVSFVILLLTATYIFYRRYANFRRP